MRALVASLLVLGGSLPASAALAQSELELGVAAYADADFPAAIAHLDRAEAEGGLERAELATLYETRALAHYALRSGDAVDADLERLVRLDPAHAFGPGVPPEILRRFDRLRGEVGVPTPAETARAAQPAPVTTAPELSQDGGASPWPWIAGAAGVAVVAAVVIVVATSGGVSGDTPVDPPVFR